MKLNKRFLSVVLIVIAMLSTAMALAESVTYIVIDPKGVNVRDAAGGGRKIDALHYEELVEVISIQNKHWMEIIISEGETAFIFKDYVRPATDEEILVHPTKKPLKETDIILVGITNKETLLRSTKDHDKILGRLQEGDMVYITHHNDFWTRVIHNGSTVAHIPTENIIFLDAYLPEGGDLYRVVEPGPAVVRNEAKTRIYARLKAGRYVRVLEIVGNRARVIYNHKGEEGYIALSYLTPATHDSIFYQNRAVE